MDPYVKLQLGNQNFRTKTHTDAGKTPSWFDVFEFVRTNEEVLNLHVYDEDTIKDDLVGSAVLELKDICIPGKDLYSDSITLTHKNKKAGELYLEINFYADQIYSQPISEFNKVQNAVETEVAQEKKEAEATSDPKVETKDPEETKAKTEPEPEVKAEPSNVVQEVKQEEKKEEKKEEKREEKPEVKKVKPKPQTQSSNDKPRPRLGPPFYGA
eukprot:TRINITY_DN1082_c0_g1_i1.p3 TRINITY_DN1082_c0_g1~~TRINITY_DN1082_c0_g1_i1.p3  ORF type:complete len:213 (-),score=68.69 TRINITY_DN1082_c0_g1_i1:100-738(-)